MSCQIYENTRQVSSMIHSARPIVTTVANIVFCCFVFLDLKSGEGRVRTDNMCENNDPYPAVTVGWPSGSTSWHDEQMSRKWSKWPTKFQLLNPREAYG